MIKAPREKKQRSTLSKVFIGFLGILSLILLSLTAVDRLGYPLKHRETCLTGVMVMLVTLLVWAGIALFLKLKSRIAKLLGGMVMGFIVMFVSILMFSYVGQFATLTIPQPYASVSHSENGRTAAVLRVLDMGLEDEEALNASVARLDARYNAMVEAGVLEAVDIEGEGYPIDAYGYVITAYPQKLKLFYHIKADVEGAIYIGYNSQAKMRYEWLDEDTVRIYLENPEPGDEGEIVVNF